MVFNSTRRGEIAEYITYIARECEHIVALVAVGSGAYGYIDELSDLDFVAATDSDENVGRAMDYIAARLGKRLGIAYFKQSPERRLQVFLADDCLEIDIGYGAYTGAAAFRPHWKVLFDKSGTVDAKMRSSWERISGAPRDEICAKTARECEDTAWHYLMHAAAAIKRGEFWRAAAEMELARNQYAALLCCRHSLDAARGRDIDKLPAEALDTLRSTLAAELSRGELLRALRALAAAIYAEINGARVGFDMLTEYINHCESIAE